MTSDNINISEESGNFQIVDIDPDYKELVEKADREDIDLFIRNSTFEHAVFLSKTLVDRAKKSIKIYSGSLSEVFYNHAGIKNPLISALNRGISIEIIVETDVDSGSGNKVLELKEKFKNLKISMLQSSIGIKNHFLVSDTSAFRLEKEHAPDEFNKENFKVFGEANFNNKIVANKLLIVFDNLRKNSASI